MEEHHAQRKLKRKTKRPPSQLRRTRKAAPQWQPGERYTVNTFQQAVRRACRRAKVPTWSVLQIRHSRGTEVRERFGVEGAAASMGHKRVETAQIYAEKNEELARRIAREIG
jgi:integrase